MSILIKNMEMPNSCFDCDFAHQDQDSEHNVYWLCAATHKDACMYERREDCPLIELPPHGDLIDRDALCKGLSDIHPVAKYANKMPTIIEADKDINVLNKQRW